MSSIPKNADEFNEQMRNIAEDMERCNEGFRSLRESNYSLKDIIERIDISAYDEITKDFEPIQYYIAFKRRSRILESLEYINELRNESYEDFVLAGNDDVELEEYDDYRKEQVELEQYELKDDIYRIISGDNISIRKEDLQYVDAWRLSLPIRSLDMRSIAFENRRCGFVGGMESKEFNDVICKIWGESPTGEDIKKLRELPDGYGWPTKGLGQHIWAEIDLNTPDEILFEAFKNWVKDARKLPFFDNTDKPYYLMSSKMIKPNHLKKWRTLRVLAYLDLRILSLLTNVPITLKQYADVLYFDEFDIDTTEKVRKTLTPAVNQILDHAYLDCLLKKVLSEN